MSTTATMLQSLGFRCHQCGDNPDRWIYPAVSSVRTVATVTVVIDSGAILTIKGHSVLLANSAFQTLCSAVQMADVINNT